MSFNGTGMIVRGGAINVGHGADALTMWGEQHGDRFAIVLTPDEADTLAVRLTEQARYAREVRRVRAESAPASSALLLPMESIGSGTPRCFFIGALAGLGLGAVFAVGWLLVEMWRMGS